jgi:catechol 2,3-dioxygenase
MPTTPFGIPPPSFRLPDDTRIGRVHLQVSDLQRSIEYYSGVLGLRVLSGSSGSAELGAHGDETPIVMLHERPGARPVPRRGLLGL